MRRILTSTFVLFCAAIAGAQSPAEEWRTIDTPHFRVHFPRDYEPFARRAASRIESIRDAVVAQVGFAPAITTDVLIVNPFAEANGATIPLLDTPRILLFTEPGDPDDQLGDYTDWIDLLVVHEMTHLVHLLRPSRNLSRRVLEHVIPISATLRLAPRWVAEGYATVIEGRLTGSGRPSSTIRAAILRKWAIAGRLPSYEQLDSDERFLGMSMAYLAGSAYLEWLEYHHGPGSLRKLWRRLTAREKRSFESAFEGVFGDQPDVLYARFLAEVTDRAMEIDRGMHAARREGTLWQETDYSSGDPAVSPDGESIAVVLRSRDEPAKLVIWPTGPDTDAEKEDAEEITRMLERDPEDVAPVRNKPLPRDPVDSLIAADGGDIESPRWMPDGEAILYVHRQPDRDGFQHRDLFMWEPESGATERITDLADVSDADPFPDGESAIAVRNRFGFSQLVRVDLTNGEVTPITEASLDRVVAHPRVSADGKRIVFGSHGQSGWQIVVRDIATGTEDVIESDDASTIVAAPEWSRKVPEEIYASVFSHGFIDIYRFHDEQREPVTRMTGGAFDPAPSPDGRMFFMSLEPDGFAVRVLDEDRTVPPAPAAFSRALDPALPPGATTPTAFGVRELPASRPYRAGRLEMQPLLGANATPSGRAGELGVRVGDVVGRFDAIAVASLGEQNAPRGGTVAAAWRGWPVTISAQLFRTTESARSDEGLELRGDCETYFPLWRLSADGGALAARNERSVMFASGSAERWQVFGRTRLSEGVDAAVEHGDRGSHTAGTLWMSLGRGDSEISISWRSDRASRETPVMLGGIAGSTSPVSLLRGRVLDPALPGFLVSGARYDGGEVQVTVPWLPADLFYRVHDLAGTRIRVAGLEVSTGNGPEALLKLPGFDVTAGVARVFDAPLRGKTRWWVGLRWMV